MSKIEIRQTDTTRKLLREDRTHYDRIRFAMHVVRMLKPRHMTVAVCEGYGAVQTSKGTDWRKGSHAQWAHVQVSRFASKEEIVIAIASLLEATSHPFVLNTLLGHPEGLS